MTRKMILTVVAFAGSLMFLLALAQFAYANGNGGNNNGPDFGGDLTCTNEAGQTVRVEDVCRANAENICLPFCAAESDAKALAICGDALAVCESGDLAFLVASTKAACDQSTAVSQSTAQDCGDTAQTCGDLTSNVTQTCPPVNITIDEATADCNRCVKRVTHFKDGSVRSVRERCYRCSVRGSVEIGPIVAQ